MQGQRRASGPRQLEAPAHDNSTNTHEGTRHNSVVSKICQARYAEQNVPSKICQASTKAARNDWTRARSKSPSSRATTGPEAAIGARGTTARKKRVDEADAGTRGRAKAPTAARRHAPVRCIDARRGRRGCQPAPRGKPPGLPCAADYLLKSSTCR